MNVTNWQKYTRQENWHPAAKLFPLIADAEMKGLAADIKAHGLLNPVMLCDKKVLDGRNRLLACKQADVETTFIEWRSTNGTSPIEWVAAQNSHRRHLTPSQKAFVAVELEKLLAKTQRSGRRMGRPLQGKRLRKNFLKRRRARRATTRQSWSA